MLDHFFVIEFACFKLVDLIIDPAKLRSIPCTKRLTMPRFRQRTQICGVIVSRTTDTDGIEFDVAFFDHTLDISKRDFAHIVHPVCEQDHDLALRFALA